MTLEAPLDVISQPRANVEQVSTVFAYEARRQARVVVRLVATEADVDRIRVAAEIYPVDVPESTEPQRRFYDFPTRQKAQAFADEALLALEYLGCTATETGTSPPGTIASAEIAA